MHYQKITLKNKVYTIDKNALVINEIPICGIRLYAKYDGQTELMVPGTGTIQLQLRSGLKSALFELDKAGYIMDNNDKYIFSEQLAKEELIIEQTKVWRQTIVVSSLGK